MPVFELLIYTNHLSSARPFLGSMQRATMQQTDQCLLYLSVSFTHLKRSAECSADGPEGCPLLSRLTRSFLQNGVWCCPSVSTRHSASRQREVLLRPVFHRSSKRRVKAVFNHHASSLKASRVALRSSLCLCAKHDGSRCCGGSGHGRCD